LTAELLGEKEFLAQVRSWKLVPASSGLFEVEVNGTLLYSKKALGRHAEEGEIRGLFEELLAGAPASTG